MIIPPEYTKVMDNIKIYFPSEDGFSCVEVHGSHSVAAVVVDRTPLEPINMLLISGEFIDRLYYRAYYVAGEGYHIEKLSESEFNSLFTTTAVTIDKLKVEDRFIHDGYTYVVAAIDPISKEYTCVDCADRTEHLFYSDTEIDALVKL